MKENFSKSLGRAFAHCAMSGDCSLDSFLKRAAWELYHEARSEFASLALIVKKGDGSYTIGRPQEVPSLPVETLLSFLTDDGSPIGSCRVRDHALDTVRFIDAHFRTSMITRIMIPPALLGEGQAVFWAGLQGCANPKKIEWARAAGAALCEWFEIYGDALRAWGDMRGKTSSMAINLREMMSVAHDARAPLGAIKYLVADLAMGRPEVSEETDRLLHELAYVDRLLSKFSPGSSTSTAQVDVVCDVVKALRRVVERFQAEIRHKDVRVSWAIPYEDARARISELDVERVLSNIVGNAVRYCQGGEIALELEDVGGKSVLIRVRDSGPGIPRDIIDGLTRSDGEGAPLPGASGWGVGLISCKNRVEAAGGVLTIKSSQLGSCIEIVVPRAVPVVEKPLMVSESEVTNTVSAVVPEPTSAPDLVLVDDDKEHSASLERLLARSGFSIRSFSSVDAALLEIESASISRVICDANMPDGGAERLLQSLKGRKNGVRLAVISGEASDEALYRFAALGAREFFSKPVEVERLVSWARS